MIGRCAAMGRGLYERLLGFDVDMRFYGSEDVDMGVKSWLMGYPVLHDPMPVIGHRFQARFSNYSVPKPYIDANKFRMARKNLGDDAWSAWISQFDEDRDHPWWKATWAAFEEGSPSVEREREYFLTHRRNDEFWYAAEFGLAWPRPDALPIPPGTLFAGGASPQPRRHRVCRPIRRLHQVRRLRDVEPLRAILAGSVASGTGGLVCDRHRSCIPVHYSVNRSNRTQTGRVRLELARVEAGRATVGLVFSGSGDGCRDRPCYTASADENSWPNDRTR